MMDELPQDQTLHLKSQEKVAFLLQPRTYPEAPPRIELVETHMSWVFLTGRYAYKLKKPVRHDFLDFSTLAARYRNCLEELRLNRRLAWNVYLDIVPLAVDPAGHVQLERTGEVIDWLVKMRQLPAERMLDYQIRQHTVSNDDLQRLAAKLCAFYRQAPAAEISPEDYRQRFAEDIQLNWRQLRDPLHALPESLLAAIHESQLNLLSRETALFDRRVTERRIVEAHGDLRPEHICLEAEPVIFDCLEFNRRFRMLDTIDELGFLGMECERLDAGFIDRLIFAIYRCECQDDPPPQLFNFYKSYRACLRARLAIWHIHELDRAQWPKWQRLARQYLHLAENYNRLFDGLG
jgi:aminoglycoside phosphotransferase family enzyme